MTQELESRVVRLEVRTDDHSEDIKELRNTTVCLQETMTSIEKNLNQIKYVVVGALAVLIVQSFGLEKAIKLIMGG
jgi:uncharacterized coiled-coil protein SlyX